LSESLRLECEVGRLPIRQRARLLLFHEVEMALATVPMRGMAR
jgi:hypothetical protein